MRPSFFPPLALQRHAFCTEIIKRERIRSVLELGCGEGNLIRMLHRPAYHLDDFPDRTECDKAIGDIDQRQGPEMAGGDSEDLAPDESDEGMKSTEIEILRRVPEVETYQREPRVQLLIGLDLQPRLSETEFSLSTDRFSSRKRWEPLRLEIWEGDLSIRNDRFLGLDCLVMSEVIEHLMPGHLEKAIPLVLSVYRPTWVIITTPNYDFNKYFVQDPNPDPCRSHRFLDPTSRTQRFFRDADHKFEWTRTEFRDWCETVSSTYDYEYEISGCGTLVNYFGSSPLGSTPNHIPPPDSPQNFYATQAVVLRRRNSSDPRNHASSIPESVELSEAPRMKFAYDEPAHQRANRPMNPSDILELVKRHFASTSRPKIELRELWLCVPELDVACGGKVVELVRAFSAENDWKLSVDESQRGLDSVWIEWLRHAQFYVKTEVGRVVRSESDKMEEETQSAGGTGWSTSSCSVDQASTDTTPCDLDISWTSDTVTPCTSILERSWY